MATMKCKVCGVGDSITFCSETGAPICEHCAVSCNVCNAPVSRDRVQLTSTGRKLCSKCMNERNERRRAKKEQLRREAKEQRHKAAAPAAPNVGGGISFEELMRDEPTLAAGLQAVKREEEAHTPEPPQDTPKSAGTSFEDLMGSGPSAPAGEQGKRAPGEAKARPGLEGMPQFKSTRLEIGPIDENRPILTGSGYQPPSKKAYIAAFLFFGLAAAIFWAVVPGIREVMMPWQSVGAEFTSNQLPVAGDTNALRNTSNINQFELFKQGPIFFLAWLIFLAYTIGFVRIVWSVGRSLTNSYLTKRRLKKAEEFAKRREISYPG